MSAANDVLAERLRQINAEGYHTRYDDEHDERQLARAAFCYVQHYVARAWLTECSSRSVASVYAKEKTHDEWPFDGDWKPKTPRLDLVRAAALLIAEIERIDRAAAKVKP